VPNHQTNFLDIFSEMVEIFSLTIEVKTGITHQPLTSGNRNGSKAQLCVPGTLKSMVQITGFSLMQNSE
jgi:hypothetical protein